MPNIILRVARGVVDSIVGVFGLLCNVIIRSCDFLGEKWYRFGKWILRHTTRLCQLQRIIYGELPGYRRIRFVEDSLRKSQSEVIKDALTTLAIRVEENVFDSRVRRREEVNNYAILIAKSKRINTKLHTGNDSNVTDDAFRVDCSFVPNLAVCLEIMFSYHDLCLKISALKAIHYDVENTSHEAKLIEIWNNLMVPEVLTGRKSRQWQYLGFQGNDPATDFRASGELGLNFILYFTRTYQERAKQVLGLSNHPSYSFPLAILMIQIIDTCHELFTHGEAKTHFYNRHAAILSLDEGKVSNIRRPDGLVDIFFDYGCVLLVEFSRFWISKKPRNIMAFPPIYKEFVKEISERLKEDNCVFLMDIQNI